MGLEVRPTSQTYIVNYAVTFLVLGAIVFFSMGSDESISRYYYSPIYNDHKAGAYEQTVGCKDCHKKSFQPVTAADCSNSGCHASYQTDALHFQSATLYEAGWASLKQNDPATLQKKRNVNASEAYHHTGWVNGRNCLDCHKAHSPPPQGEVLTFPHTLDGVLFPTSGRINRCVECHLYSQAPPIVAHSKMLRTRDGNCFDCHLSTKSWTEQTEWYQRPVGKTTADGAVPLPDDMLAEFAAAAQSGGQQPVEQTTALLLSNAPVATPAAGSLLPSPTPQALTGTLTILAELPTPTPTPLPATPSQPPATPIPDIPVEINWNTFWYKYESGMRLSGYERPVLLIFTSRNVAASNRFEVSFERCKQALRYIYFNYLPVRVEAAEHPDVMQQYQVPFAPGIVRLNKDGTIHSRALPQGRLADDELLLFLSNP